MISNEVSHLNMAPSYFIPQIIANLHLKKKTIDPLPGFTCGLKQVQRATKSTRVCFAM